MAQPSGPVDLARLYQRLTALRHVKRFQRFPLLWPQSVAEHSYFAAVLAAVFADQVNALPPDVVEYEEVSVEQVIRGALWHDTAEAWTADIPHDVKRAHPDLEARLEELETVIGADLLRQAGPAWEEPDRDTLEYKLIKMADWVELLLYVATEKRGGNHALEIAEQRIWTALRVYWRERMGKHGPGVLRWYDDQLHALAVGLHGEPI